MKRQMIATSKRGAGLAAALVACCLCGTVHGQSSSLFSGQNQPTAVSGSAAAYQAAQSQPATNLSQSAQIAQAAATASPSAGLASGAVIQGPIGQPVSVSSPAGAALSGPATARGQKPMVLIPWTAIEKVETRQFQVQDLVTIIVKENNQTTLESSIETEKESKLDGKVSAIPKLQLKDILNGQFNATSSGPDLGVSTKKEFKGEGDYERREAMSTRLTARIVEILPNGLLKLEATKFIKNDDEVTEITVTGTVSPTTITAANTVLSTEMAGLRVVKSNSGELRKVNKKGLIPNVLETIFNF